MIIAFIIIMMSQGCGDEELSSYNSEETDVNFTVLQSSQYSNYTEYHSKILKVINTQSEYASELVKYSDEEAPIIDFSSYNVVLVDLGERANDAYYIEIRSVYKDAKGHLHVVVISKEPSGENCIASDVITDPYIFIKIPASGNVFFDEKLETYSCP